MKRITFILATILLLCGFNSFARKVEISDARQVGKNFYYERVNLSDNVPYSTLKVTGEYTISKDETPVYYVFNIDNNGFVIVSADNVVTPVIGYGFNSTYSPSVAPCGFEAFMDNIQNEILYWINSGVTADQSTTAAWSHYLVTDADQLNIQRGERDVEPLVNSTWNQDFPFNGMCPEDPNSPPGYGGRVPVGCVSTAMTQLMFYWRFPQTGSGNHCIFPQPSYGAQCANFGATTYDWEGMDNYGKNGGGFKESDPLATLAWHGGISVDMDYGPDGSGAQSYKVPNALKTYFHYSTAVVYAEKADYTTTNWNNMLKTDLDAKIPIYYSGYNTNGGHAWICDGYQGTDFFHFNWGWGGMYNGYFYLNNLNPGGDPPFSSGQAAVFHIQPDASLYPYFCTGEHQILTNDFGSIEDGSGPVADYQSNANCSWLIAPDDSINKITLDFFRFDLGAGDVVTVYDGPTTSSNILGTYTGTTIPADVTSTGPQMLITLTTDGSGQGNGFQADYETILNAFCNTSTTLTEPTGVITDGSGRFDYRNGTICKYYIKPTDAATVTLSFNSFKTEAVNDKVQIYDLGTSTLLETYSGDYTTLPADVTATSGQMLVIFSSNNTLRGEGFEADYTITVATPEIEGMSKIRVFPNPASGLLNISFNVKETQNVTMDLISLRGTTVYSESLSNVTGQVDKKLDVSNFAKGVYLLRISGNKGILNTKVVVE
jgi:hypothetical protein